MKCKSCFLLTTCAVTRKLHTVRLVGVVVWHSWRQCHNLSAFSTQDQIGQPFKGNRIIFIQAVMIFKFCDFYRLPAAGQQEVRIVLLLLLVVLRTKLQIYRISCCLQAKQVGDEVGVL